jgi:ATP-dependent RNA helicase DeaD
VHRIGRTGRAGNKGRAITFATPEQRGEVISIENLIRTTLPVKEHPELPKETFNKPQKVFSSRFSKRRRISFRRR